MPQASESADGARYIDELMPLYHFVERHCLNIPAEPLCIWNAMQRVRVNGSNLVRLAVWLRMLGVSRSRKNQSVNAIFDLGGMPSFLRLHASEPRELCLGMVGQFWRLSGGLTKIDSDAFSKFDDGMSAKLVWGFFLKPIDQGTRLSTETRVYCPSRYARLRFLPYWLVIRPVSGLIRGQILQDINAEAMLAD